jgi:hypothetical protein
MEHKQSKSTAEQGSPNNVNVNKFKMIDAMVLNIIRSRSPSISLRP